MNEHIVELVRRHRAKGVLVDTNILLLLFVGLFDPAQIPKFKRTAQFAPEDYGLLHEFLDCFVRIVTTPNILTEACNLAGQLPDWAKDRCAPLLTGRICAMDEKYVESGLSTLLARSGCDVINFNHLRPQAWS